MTSLVSVKRELVARSLERSFPGPASAAERRRIARRHFQFVRVNEAARACAQLRRFSRSRAFQVQGLNYLDEALAEGNGAILLTAHVGYGRLIRPLLASRGYSIRLVGRARSTARPQDSRAGRFARTRLLRLPGRERAEVADIEPGINLRPHLKALARNDVLVITADGEDAWSAFPVTVLRRTINFAPGVISLARTSGAAVLPALAVDAGRRVGQGIRLEIGAPLPLDSARDAAKTLRPFVDAFERCLKAYPHLWRWSNRYLERHERGPASRPFGSSVGSVS